MTSESSRKAPPKAPRLRLGGPSRITGDSSRDPVRISTSSTHTNPAIPPGPSAGFIRPLRISSSSAQARDTVPTAGADTSRARKRARGSGTPSNAPSETITSTSSTQVLFPDRVRGLTPPETGDDLDIRPPSPSPHHSHSALMNTSVLPPHEGLGESTEMSREEMLSLYWRNSRRGDLIRLDQSTFALRDWNEKGQHLEVTANSTAYHHMYLNQEY
jgi:hypothetical protein